MLSSAPTSVIEEPAAWLSHRSPFLFVDRAEIAGDQLSLRAQRRFLAEEVFFAGHFPGDPVVPGVILIELLAQSANLLLSHRAGRAVRGYLVGVEGAKFNRPVQPGETVDAEVRFVEPPQDAQSGAARICTFQGVALVGNRRCMRAVVSIYYAG